MGCFHTARNAVNCASTPVGRDRDEAALSYDILLATEPLRVKDGKLGRDESSLSHVQSLEGRAL